MTDTIETNEIPTTEQDVDQAAEQTTEAATLNVNDLDALRAIIDLASSRGAFKTSEMAAVGTAYNKLDAFLSEVAKQSAEQSAEQDALPTSEEV